MSTLPSLVCHPTRRAWLALCASASALATVTGVMAGCRRLRGAPAPEFEATTQYGRQVRLSDYRGKVLLLTFWATWCSHCRSQLAAMDRFASDHQSAGVAMLALSVDEQGWEVVRPYLGQAGHVLSVGVADNNTRRAYGASRAIPITYIISAEGMVITDIVGALDLTSLKEIATRHVA